MDAVQDIKQRLSVEEVIGDYIELKRSGRNFKGLSPFTNEKSPSFMVSPEKQIWHCFSSNKGGDMFTFIQEIEGVDFRGALELLARKSSIDLSLYSQSGNSQTAVLKKRLYDMHTLAARFYQQSLSKHEAALSYIKERGFKRQAVLDFQLGYSPSAGQALTGRLKQKGFTDEEIQKAGLGVRRGNKLHDMFINRLMVPLSDGQARVVGFTARALGEALPKYLNTPQTLLYDKGRQLYGLHLAKEAIRQQDAVVIVEGNLDVIASHQAGVKFVVASAGTAVTSDHLKQINRLTQNVYLAFDQDAAGINATIRAIGVAQSVGVQLDIVTIPSGKDPDDLIRNNPASWQEAIDAHEHVVDWLVKHFSSEFNLESARGKTQFTAQVLPILKQLSDPVEKEHYLKKIASIIDVSVSSLEQKLHTISSSGSTQRKSLPRRSDKPAEDELRQDTLLCLLVSYPETRVSIGELSADKFSVGKRRTLFNFVQAHPEQVFAAALPGELKELEEYVNILLLKAEELYGEWTGSDRSVEAIGLAHRLLHKDRQKTLNDLTEAIRQAEEAQDSQKVQELLNQYQSLLAKE